MAQGGGKEKKGSGLGMNVGRSRRVHDTFQGGPSSVARPAVCLLKGGRQMQEKFVWSPPLLEHLFSVTLMWGRGIAAGGEGVR